MNESTMSDTGAIEGTVSTSQGERLPGVLVEIVNSQTQNERASVTDAEGRFVDRGVDPGSYSLKATLPGFKPYDRQNVVVRAHDTVNLEVTLVPASPV